MTFTRALAALALVLAATSATAAVHRDVTDGTARFAVGTAAGRGPLIASPRVTAFGVGASAATQDAEAVEAVLGLDRSTRRVIQQGLRNEGFDAGTPDGLFGPRTRAAIRDWQTSRGATATGYLNGAEVELLRAAVAPPPAMSEAPPPAPVSEAAPSVSPGDRRAARSSGADGGELRGVEHGSVFRGGDGRGRDRLPCCRD